jgi:Rad3-related DNA helicase
MTMKTFADAEVQLASRLPGYESRVPQQQFAQAVEAVYDTSEDDIKSHLMAQAGTGVGKSLGYLIPAILSGQRTVVSVTTKALQSQLARKDMPFLEANLGVRFSWAMLQGRSNYLCLSGSTRVMTRDGYVPIKDLAGGEHEIVDGDGNWVTAPIREYGNARLMRITMSRHGRTKEILATADHRWFMQASPAGAIEEITTSQMMNHPRMLRSKGLKLAWGGPRPVTTTPRVIPSPFGIARGVVYGDGTVYRKGGAAATVVLHGTKDAELLRYFEGHSTSHTHQDGYAEPQVQVFGLPHYFKDERPGLGEASTYLYGWLAGYFAADGCVSKHGHCSISSARRSDLEYVERLCIRLGIMTSEIRVTSRVGKGTEASALYSVSLSPQTLGEDFFVLSAHSERIQRVSQRRHRAARRWTVDSVEQTDLCETVYCAEVPTTHSFVLEGNILTGNCLNRCAMADLVEVPMLPEILRKAAEPGFGGTQDDLGMSIPWQAWKLICSDEDECDGDCTEMSGCFVAAARSRAISADVLIVNHALFFADLIMKGGTAPEDKRSEGMLGRYDVAIFDEAHEIFSSAADAMGGQVTLGALAGATGEIRTWISRYADSSNNLQPVESSVSAAMGAGQDLFAKIQDGKMTPRHIMALESELGTLYQALRDLDTDFSGLTYRALTGTTEGATAAKRKRSVTKRIRNLLDKVTTIIMADEHEMVRWVEFRMGGRNGGTPIKTIKMSPVEIGPFMQDRLLRWTSCVFVSATLSPGGSFTYMASRFGLRPGTWTHLDVGSPFDFTTQARLYVPGHISAPNSGSWETEANEEICDLLKISRGRALVLFTSIKHMRAAHASISRRVPFEIKAQGDLPNGDLVDWLKGSADGVIFATKSFFTGVDIQGAALSLVILTKLPFPVPTEPLFQAQSEAIEARGGNSFGSLSVPETSLVLQQAVGRLIRHRNDVGMVAILDPRIIQKGYGKTLLKDLPPIPREGTLDSLSEWFAAEEALMALPSS